METRKRGGNKEQANERAKRETDRMEAQGKREEPLPQPPLLRTSSQINKMKTEQPVHQLGSQSHSQTKHPTTENCNPADESSAKCVDR